MVELLYQYIFEVSACILNIFLLLNIFIINEHNAFFHCLMYLSILNFLAFFAGICSTISLYSNCSQIMKIKLIISICTTLCCIVTNCVFLEWSENLFKSKYRYQSQTLAFVVSLQMLSVIIRCNVLRTIKVVKYFALFDNTECSICLESLHFTMYYKSECSHKFHINCISEWLNNSSDCPICRSYLRI